MPSGPIRWGSPPEGTESVRARVQRLRDLIEEVAEGRKLSTLALVAQEVGLSPTTLSTAANGRTVPSTAALLKLLEQTSRSADERAEWLATFKRDPLDTVQPADWLAEASASWLAPDSSEPDYRDMERTLSREQLQQVLERLRGGRVSPKGEEWVFLVASAIHWGERYLAWAKAAGPRNIAVLELLCELLLSRGFRYRWRAGWLLQQLVEDDHELRVVCQLATDMLKSIPEHGRAMSEADLALITHSVLDRRVEVAVAEQVVEEGDQEFNKEFNDKLKQLLAEFAKQTNLASARGKLGRLLGEGGDPVTAAFLAKELLGATRPFHDAGVDVAAWIAAGRQAELDGEASPYWVLIKARGDIDRLKVPPASTAASAVVTHLKAWRRGEVEGEAAQQRADELLARFNEAVDPHTTRR